MAKALEKDRARRYASAGDLAADLRALPAGGSRSWHGPPRRCISSASSPGGTRRLVAGASGIFAAAPGWGPSCTILFALRSRGERAGVATGTGAAATYQSYRPRIAAAVAAALASRRRRCGPSARRHTAGPARLGVAAPAQPGSTTACRCSRATAGGSRFLILDPSGIRIASLTPAGLRLTDLDGNELLTRPFRPENHSVVRVVLPTRHGLRLAGGDGDREAQALLSAVEISNTNLLSLMDEEGHGLARLQGPRERRASLLAMSPDGEQVAVIWMGSPESGLYAARHGDGQSSSASPTGTSVTPGPLPSMRTAPASPPAARMG